MKCPSRQKGGTNRADYFHMDILSRKNRDWLWPKNNKNKHMKKYLSLFLVFFITATYGQQWTKQYDFVDDYAFGLAKVGKANKYGYANNKGELIVALIYDEATAFREGKAAVRSGDKWGYIDSTGKVVEEPKYEDAGCFRDSLAVVRKNDKYGYINHNFILVIPYQYESARGFSEGLAPVSNSKGLWGYINKKGNIALSYQFNFADFFIDGKARVMKDGKMIMIDKQGKEVKEEE